MSDQIHIVPVPAFKDNYIWTIIDKEKHNAIIVDPGEAIPIELFLKQQQLQLKGILITHHHWDHTNGIIELKKNYDVPIFAPANETVSGATMFVKENDNVVIDDFPIRFTVMDIPGHTLGHIAYYAPNILFCGDTLFSAGCGKIFEGTPTQMYHSLQKLVSLPDETKIYCGHEYTLSNLQFAQLVEPNNKHIAERMKAVASLRDKHLPTLPSLVSIEKETNPFLRCEEATVKESASKQADRHLTNPIDVFTLVRTWKNEVA